MAARLIYNHAENGAGHSGYDQLAKYVDGEAWDGVQRFRITPSKTLYHYFHAESDLRISTGFRLRFNSRIVATFHQPPNLLDNQLE